MKKITIGLFFVFFTFKGFCQHNFTQVLGDVASVSFPDTPKTKNGKKGNVVFVLRTDSMIYLATASKLKIGILELFDHDLKARLFDGVITGSLTQKNDKLFYKKKITYQGSDGIEFGYRSAMNGEPSYRYHRAFYFNNTLIIEGAWSLEPLRTSDKKIASFFDTFKVISTPASRAAEANKFAYSFGKIIGYLLVIGVFILIGVGIVFIIQKIIYK